MYLCGGTYKEELETRGILGDDNFCVIKMYLWDLESLYLINYTLGKSYAIYQYSKRF
jgi:hypothetical protein